MEKNQDYLRHWDQRNRWRYLIVAEGKRGTKKAGQNGIFRDRTAEGQKGGTERRDKRAFPRDRMAKGQKSGTERLGQKGRDRMSRIRSPGPFTLGIGQSREYAWLFFSIFHRNKPLEKLWCNVHVIFQVGYHYPIRHKYDRPNSELVFSVL